MYGTSIQLSHDGKSVIIASAKNDDAGYNKGSVRVYKWSEYTLEDEENEKYYYTGMIQNSLQTKPIIITSYLNTYNYSPIVGKKYWTQVGSDIHEYIDMFTKQDDNHIDIQNVSINGDGTIIAKGYHIYDSNRGEVKVYRVINGEWTIIGEPIYGESSGDNFGNNISLSKDGYKIVITAYTSSNILNRCGIVYVYQWNGNYWELISRTISGTQDGQMHGEIISTNDNCDILAIGSLYYDTNISEIGVVETYKLVSDKDSKRVDYYLNNELKYTSHSIYNNTDDIYYPLILSNGIGSIFSQLDLVYKINCEHNTDVLNIENDVNTLITRMMSNYSINNIRNQKISINSSGNVCIVAYESIEEKCYKIHGYQITESNMTEKGNIIEIPIKLHKINYVNIEIKLSKDGHTIFVILTDKNNESELIANRVMKVYSYNSNSNLWIHDTNYIDSNTNSSNKKYYVNNGATRLYMSNNTIDIYERKTLRVDTLFDLLNISNVENSVDMNYSNKNKIILEMKNADIDTNIKIKDQYKNAIFTNKNAIIKVNKDGGFVYDYTNKVIPENITNKSWVQMGEDIDGEAQSNMSGYSVALSSDGSIVAIGAVINTHKNGDYSGHVRVYEWNGSSWVQRGGDIDGEGMYDMFGNSVSLSSDGSILAIGAESNSNTNGVRSGHVRIYEWVKQGNHHDNVVATTKEGDRNVYYIKEDIDNNMTWAQIENKVKSKGGVLLTSSEIIENRTVFIEDGSDKWVPGYQDDGVTRDWLQIGTSPHYYGKSCVRNAGGYPSWGDSNTAYDFRDKIVYKTYDMEYYDWKKRGRDIEGEAEEDYSGWSVSLSSDGSILAIGAPWNHGVNGYTSGHVRVYEWNVHHGSNVLEISMGKEILIGLVGQ